MELIVLLALLQGSTPASDDKTLQSWIDALNSDTVEVRSEASKKLLEAGDAAIPYLKREVEHPDLERRSRCRELVARIEFEKRNVEPGARKLAEVGISTPSMRLNPERQKAFDELLAAGKIGEIIDKDYEWLTYAIDGILSDQKVVAFGSLRIMHEIIKKRAIPNAATDLVSKPDLKQFCSAELRAAEYSYWATWWFTVSARRFVAEWDKEAVTDRINDWREALRLLRSGEGLQDPSSKPSQALKTIKSMEKGAWPILIRFLDDDELPRAATALRLLQELTGRKSDALTEQNKAAVKADWYDWWQANR